MKESYKNLDHICFSFGCLSKENLYKTNFWDSSIKEGTMIHKLNNIQLENNFNNYYILSDEDIKNNVILNIEDLKEFIYKYYNIYKKFIYKYINI